MTKEQILAQIEMLKAEISKLEELVNKSKGFELKFPDEKTFYLGYVL